jgi:centromeric protein E
MMGTNENPGIVPLAVAEIFNQIANTPKREYLLRVGFIEIYNENVYDLLSEKKNKLTKFSENDQGEIITNLTERIIPNAESMLESYQMGIVSRKIGDTAMNEQSSRSHAIFRIVIESKEPDSNEGVVQFSSLNLVDLAGSERVGQTNATGERFREGNKINMGLFELSSVIRQLSNMAENGDTTQYVNYRNSKLTRMLSASIGGNARTAIICTVTPAAVDETFSTLT